MIPKGFGRLRIKLHSLRYRGAKGTRNDTEKRAKLVFGVDEELTQSLIMMMLMPSRRQNWEDSLWLLLLCFIYSRDSHTHWVWALLFA